MNFQPSTTLYIGTVPYDNSYQHVRYYETKVEQEEHIKSFCPLALRRDDYTYQRIDNSIVVPFNAEQLYGYNYCMFQNSNYGDRWFYSFITNIEYVNPNSSRLFLSLDFMQTWFIDCSVPPCMVEREHVNDDTIGAHIRDEGLNPGQMKCVQTKYDRLDLVIIVASAAEPNTDGTYVNCKGDIYENVASGTSLTCFRLDELNDFKSYIDALSSNGQQDAISSIYMIPSEILPGTVKKDDGWGSWVKGSTGAVSSRFTCGFKYDSLDGYIPKNNKLYCYPFTYGEISNCVGGNQQFAFEFFNAGGDMVFDRKGGVDVNSCVLYVPRWYNGCEEYYEAVLQLATYPTCNWVYQSYSNMLGQSEYDVEGTTIADYYGFKDVADYWANNGKKEFGTDSNLLTYLAKIATTPMYEGKGNAFNLANEFNVQKDLLSGNVVGAFTNNIDSQVQLSQAQRQPNTIRGGTNSSVTLANINAFQAIARKYTLRAEVAEQIDDYFSMYGYNVSVMKHPNFIGRKNWNYVKTIGANVQGKIPVTVKSAINQLLNRGVTFWHTDDVGNYSLNNSIV